MEQEQQHKLDGKVVEKGTLLVQGANFARVQRCTKTQAVCHRVLEEAHDGSEWSWIGDKDNGGWMIGSTGYIVRPSTVEIWNEATGEYAE